MVSLNKIIHVLTLVNKWSITNICIAYINLSSFQNVHYQKLYLLEGSYDAILNIFLCIWCNRICWHALMLKKKLYFSNTVHYCRSSPKLSCSTKPLLPTIAVWSDWPTDPVHCDWPNTPSMHQKCNAPYHNRELQISSWFYHQFKPERGTVTWQDTVMMLVCICSAQATIKTISDGLHTPLWCDTVPHTHTHTLTLSHTHTHTHTHDALHAKLCIWTVNSKYLN